MDNETKELFNGLIADLCKKKVSETAETRHTIMDYQSGSPQNGPGNGYNPHNNNPYNNNPYNPYGAPIQPAPVVYKGEGMATASMVLGIISLASLLILQISIPFLLGGVSIILAILSRGSLKKLFGRAKAGIICSSVALGLDVSFLILALWLVFFLPNRSPQFREDLNNACEQQYGVSYDELIEEMENVWDGNSLNEDFWEKMGY